MSPFYDIQDWEERMHRYLGWNRAHFIVEVEHWHLVGQMYPVNMLSLACGVFL